MPYCCWSVRCAPVVHLPVLFHSEGIHLHSETALHCDTKPTEEGQLRDTLILTEMLSVVNVNVKG